MAKFIEINDHCTANIDRIAWIASDNEGLSSKIYVGDREYDSDIPYKTLVSILKTEEMSSVEQKLDQFLSVATITTV